MAKNENLHNAKRVKNDEFYTLHEDIEREMNAYLDFNKEVFKGKSILMPCDDPEWSEFTKIFVARFSDLGLKKLTCTSYAFSSKGLPGIYQASLFEQDNPQYDENKSAHHGKVFTMTRRKKKIDIENLSWRYLESDGDFRSEEVTKLRDEADIIITNPPFSLFREFLAWIMEANKQFIILGNQNAVTYKEVFPYIKQNKIWYGPSIRSGGMWLRMPDNYDSYSSNVVVRDDGHHYINLAGIRWFTNIDHGVLHKPLILQPATDALKFNKKLIKALPKDENGKPYYPKYDNYDAIEVPVTDGIPSDYKPCWYDCVNANSCPYAQAEGMKREAIALCETPVNGVIGVPITFMDKYCPDQFEILGATESEGSGFSNGLFHSGGKTKQPVINIENALDSESIDCDSVKTDRQTDRLSVYTNEYSSGRRKCNGLMGVPITFLDKFCPEQFEIVGKINNGPPEPYDLAKPKLFGKYMYKRLAIRAKV